MYKAYCTHCGTDWENSSPNCPHCGTPNHSAERVPENGRGRRAKKKAAQPMNDKQTSFTSLAADAVKQGALMATANEANNALKAGVGKMLEAAGVPPEMLEGALFQKGMPLLTATTVLFLAERFPDMIPKSDSVVKAAQLALSQATTETIEPLLRAAAPTLLALASAGDKAKEIEGDVYTDEGEDDIEEGEYDERPIDVTPQEPEQRRREAPRAPSAQPARSRD